jgi:ABC-2 type transport system permease protein
MSRRGIAAVIAVECSKLARQLKVRLVIGVCLAAPFVFAVTIRVQDSLPSDTLFGRAVKESGFATPLVILGFASLWGFPAISSIVGGDLFASEDRYMTWKTLLTRSRSRAELFAGKAIVALGFSWLAAAALAAGSIAAGILVLGAGPLIDLSGVLRPAPEALRRVLLAWATTAPPIAALSAVAVMASVLTRSSVAGTGLPVLLALTMQLSTLVDGAEGTRRLLVTTGFEAWHVLLTETPSYRPLADAALVSLTYTVGSLAVAYWALQRRDIGG